MVIAFWVGRYYISDNAFPINVCESIYLSTSFLAPNRLSPKYLSLKSDRKCGYIVVSGIISGLSFLPEIRAPDFVNLVVSLCELSVQTAGAKGQASTDNVGKKCYIFVTFSLHFPI